jgi:hypothetical protein
MTAMLLSQDPLHNPLDVAELVVMDRDWAFDRLDDGELMAEVAGVWCNYRMWFSWNEEMSTMSLTCGIEPKLPKTSIQRMYQLIAMVNEKLWLGHFNLAHEDMTIGFHHALLIRDGAGTSSEQLKDLIDIALQECERFYPAFQSVVWGGKSPAEAIELALFETIAEA